MGTPAEEKIFDLAAAMPKMSAGAIVDAASKAAELFFDDFPIDAPAAATFIGYATTALAHAYFRRKLTAPPIKPTSTAACSDMRWRRRRASWRTRSSA